MRRENFVTIDKVLAVNETWLPRCDHGQFFTSVQMDPSIPHSTVLKNIPDDYNYLFHKTMTSIHYAFTNVSDQFDWYFKADDDTYVIMEHMYEYLATLDPTEPYYLGYTLRPYLKRGYNGGGAGYVMSRAAVKLFLKRSFFNRTICPIDLSEDVGIGRCLENIEIYPHDTRNEKRQQRFNTYRPIDMFQGLIADEWHYYKQIKARAFMDFITADYTPSYKSDGYANVRRSAVSHAFTTIFKGNGKRSRERNCSHSRRIKTTSQTQ
ncbi:hypothetical protein DICVIV_13709 [Dictyocaulus viviparus]|uniref:N-acetylgalactosaminide beta-1,3-galactosyltransferase n=1 Tax=Dictyocaulus viviparus TaxID=29172 RepID=A0A0D8X731_DICVI|nr:hypothetical protein DICVIV_13709 [Dictyocaulus viviparus]